MTAAEDLPESLYARILGQISDVIRVLNQDTQEDKLSGKQDAARQHLQSIERDLDHRFESTPELRGRPPDAVRHRPDLPVLLGEQYDDPVGLPQAVGAQHHRLVAIELLHASSPPKRRRRPAYSATASAK